jgi:CubicO group peptidase (beta-lactamase class C family)
LTPRFGQIGSIVKGDFAKRTVGSVTVGVVSGKQLIWTNSYGYADMETKTTADQNTVYRIGSLTKMFTALMLEQLVQAGIVKFSDPVEKYFPEVNTIKGKFRDAEPITLGQLATHTAGLGREPDDETKYAKGPVSDWEETLIAALPHTHFEFKPGSRFLYSNIGFAILGAALSRAAAEPYTRYVPGRIFEPLGMTHSAMEPNPNLLPHLSKGYLVENRSLFVDSKTAQREHEGRGYKVPNGAVYTTVGDLARFASFLLGEGPATVLKNSSLESDLSIPADSSYGLGVMIVKRKGYIALGHNGAVAGYQAALMLNREAGMGVIILANVLGTVDTTDLALQALDILSN